MINDLWEQDLIDWGIYNYKIVKNAINEIKVKNKFGVEERKIVQCLTQKFNSFEEIKKVFQENAFVIVKLYGDCGSGNKNLNHFIMRYAVINEELWEYPDNFKRMWDRFYPKHVKVVEPRLSFFAKIKECYKILIS